MQVRIYRPILKLFVMNMIYNIVYIIKGFLLIGWIYVVGLLTIRVLFQK